MDDDIIEYAGRVGGVEDQFVQQLPATLKCRSCGRTLVKTKKDHQQKHMSLDIRTTRPPEILHDGAVFAFVCDKCGSRTLVRFRSDPTA